MFKSIFIFSILIIAISNKKIADEASASADFFDLLKPAVTEYSEEPKEIKGLKLNRYKNPSTHAHIIDVYFNTKGESFAVEFKKAKKEDVIKTFREYDNDSLRIQSKAFKEFISKMVKIEEDSDELYLNMIEDVKEEILTLEKATKKTGLLKFKELVQGDWILLDLYYGVHLLGKFEITSIQNSATSFSLVVKYITIEDQKELSDEIKIDVLTKDSTHLRTEMNKMLKKFNMEQFINSLDDASDRFEAFFRNPRAGFKENKISLIMNKFDPNSNKRDFVLKSVDEEVPGSIIYKAALEEHVFGSYEFNIAGQEPKINPFNRMNHLQYEAFLEGLELDHLFVSLYDKIRFIYEHKVSSVFSEYKAAIKFNNKYIGASMFLSKERRTDDAVYNAVQLCSLLFTEEGDKIEVFIMSSDAATKEFGFKFDRKTYNKDTTERFISLAVESIEKASNGNSSVLGKKNKKMM